MVAAPFCARAAPLARAEQPLDPLRIAALAELALMPKPYDGAPAGAWLQQLNGLLKRLCRNDYPYSQSHTLNGRKWLAFPDNRCPAAGLTRWMVLVEGAYKPECKLDDKRHRRPDPGRRHLDSQTCLSSPGRGSSPCCPCPG